MGGNLSRPYEGEGETPYPGLADIPESCVARIFQHLGPVDIRKLAGLNWAFKGASSCDYVWEQKLPICYQEMLSKLFTSEPHFLSKKQIYAHLCHPISFDDATKVQIYLSVYVGFLEYIFGVFNIFNFEFFFFLEGCIFQESSFGVLNLS